MKGRVKVVFFSLGAGVTLSCGCRTSVLPKLGSDVISSHPVLECCAFGIAKPDKISHSPLVAFIIAVLRVVVGVDSQTLPSCSLAWHLCREGCSGMTLAVVANCV